MTDRERYALRMMLIQSCCRYCLVTARGENAEKGDAHWFISRILSAFIHMKGGDYLLRGIEDCPPGMVEVHDYLADGLTDRMDEVIGLPLLFITGETYVNSQKYGELMLSWIFDHFDDMCEKCRDDRY